MYLFLWKKYILIVRYYEEGIIAVGGWVIIKFWIITMFVNPSRQELWQNYNNYNETAKS